MSWLDGITDSMDVSLSAAGKKRVRGGDGVPFFAHFLALSILGQAEWGLGVAQVKCEEL